MYIVTDIDGTIAGTSKRIHYLNESPKNFKKFYEEMSNSEEILPVVSILRTMYNCCTCINRLCFCTGRPEAYREKTREWLEYCFGNIGSLERNPLLMRKTGDKRPDHIIKLELLKEAGITPKNTLCIFEDRSRVVKAYRNAGFNVMQVAEGDY